jgi:TolA-binding protein
MTHRTVSKSTVSDSTNSDPEPNYDISLDNNYQDFTSYIYMGNRMENFTAYFNTHFKADEDFEEAMAEYRTSLISIYSRRLDSLGVVPPVSPSVKEKLNKSIERASKIIQFHKNSKYIDNAVLLIGMSYYYLGDYYNAERKFDEFISKLSSSENADEAILFLGRTKFRLGKKDEGKVILENLLKSTTDNEIKSKTVRDLGILAFNSGKIADASDDFKASIDYSDDNERKAEGQYILAKLVSIYKPEQSAQEYRKVLDYTSDFDLTFYSKLNEAKGLIYIKKFQPADEILTDLRKKYRDFPEYTQLVDLEFANNLYAKNNLFDANNKYYEVIVKYPGSISASDAYYYIAKHEEDINKDYLNALLNFKKSVEENPNSEFHKESMDKVATLERYFTLLGNVQDSVKISIPTTNTDVEKYRRKYNEEKGIEQPEVNDGENPDNKGTPPPPSDDGSNTSPDGRGKGRPGGFSSKHFNSFSDSLEIPEEVPEKIPEEIQNENEPNPGNTNEIPQNIENVNPEDTKTETKNPSDSKNPEEMKDESPEKSDSLNKVSSFNSDSAKAVADSIAAKEKEDKIFNSYYEIAEIFIYNLSKKDSVEFYLNILLKKFPDPERQAKVLYTLGNYYKNNKNTEKADEIFEKIISGYPNSVYAFESKKILGLISNASDIAQSPVDETYANALNLYKEGKYDEAVGILHEVESKFPNDSVVARALYGLGFIYENNLVNKDSTLFYYKKLQSKFPESLYAEKVAPLLEYYASLEVKDSSVASDSSKVIGIDSTQNIQTGKDTTNTVKSEEKPKEENTEEVVVPEPNNVGTENNLSPEEIEKLLKETEAPPDK